MAITQIKVRRGNAADWTTTNPVLADGEPGFEHDTGRRKWGDGVRAWNSLPYAAGAATIAVGTVTTGAPGTDVIITNTGDENDAVLDFTIPAGEDGPPNTLTVGTVTTGDPVDEGGVAIVDITGTAPTQVIDFTLPTGPRGLPGVDGTDAYPIYVGQAGVITTTGMADNSLLFEYA